MTTPRTLLVIIFAFLVNAPRLVAEKLPPGAIQYICYAVTDLRKQPKICFTKNPKEADVLLSITSYSITADRTICITEYSSTADLTIHLAGTTAVNVDRKIFLVDDPKKADVVVCILDNPTQETTKLHFTEYSSTADTTVCFTEYSSTADISITIARIKSGGK